MKASFEEGEIVIRMSVREAGALSCELFYTIDYRPEEHPDFYKLESAIDSAIDEAGGKPFA